MSYFICIDKYNLIVEYYKYKNFLETGKVDILDVEIHINVYREKMCKKNIFVIEFDTVKEVLIKYKMECEKLFKDFKEDEYKNEFIIGGNINLENKYFTFLKKDNIKNEKRRYDIFLKNDHLDYFKKKLNSPFYNGIVNRGKDIIVEATTIEELKLKYQETYKKFFGSDRRLEWTEFFKKMCKMISNQSTCKRRKVGAVIVKDNRLLASGYNASASGILHCIDQKEPCYRIKNNIPSGSDTDKCYALHAEENALIQCANYGISCKDADIFITTSPCSRCTKLIINSGIKRVFYMEEYNDQFAKDLQEYSKVEFIKI